MVDLPDSSIIVAGLDQWEYERNRIPVIEEPRLVRKLERILQVQNLTLRKPPAAVDEQYGFHPKIVGYRFPEWFIVQKTETTQRGYRRRKLVHVTSLDGDRYRDEDQRLHIVVPVRFVRACRKGHVGDINWKAFVHGSKPPCPRQLWIEERGTSGDLDEIWILCDCGEERVMSQAARIELKALGMCDGSRPWLGPGTKEKCGEPLRLLIRSASNAYFPQLMSVISIPDTRGPIDEVVNSLWDDFLFEVNTNDDLQGLMTRPTVALRLQGLDLDDVLAAINRRRAGGVGQDRPVKEVEFEALSEAREEIGSDAPEGDFYARALPPAQWNCEWMNAVERVVLVHRLREVVAQVGFTRFESAGPDIQGELSLDVQRAPLALDANWLPAVENRGEGIFIQLRNEAIRQWVEKTEVRSRGSQLQAGFDRWRTEHQLTGAVFPGLPYYMIHSLSHALLTAISLECGYPASSLRERIYASHGRYGILIYTGSPDAEGTLGGLILAGRDIRRHFWYALEMAALCSNDPVCALHVPGEHDHQPLLGSACHGCLLIAETSCEQRNDFLDRALLVPTVESLGANFFDISS